MVTTSTLRAVSEKSASKGMVGDASKEWIAEVLAFHAPYLEERLVKYEIAANVEEAARLFCEIKKYLILAHIDKRRGYSVSSNRIDAAWHEFVLFTMEYAGFCDRYFHIYLHHDPARTGGPPSASHPGVIVDYNEFGKVYEKVFGTPLSDLWRDDLFVTLDTRLRNEFVASSSVRVRGGKAELVQSEETVLARIDAWAEP